MDQIWLKRALFTAGIGLGVAASSACLYLLFKTDDDFDKNFKRGSVVTTNHSVVKIRVPKEAIGAVIGRSGEHIKKVQTNTNTRIHFDDTIGDNGVVTDGQPETRVLLIRGSPKNVTKAEVAINAVIAQQLSITSKQILIPNKTVGAIIGRNGDNIRSLCDRSGAKIVVQSKDKITGQYRKDCMTGYTKVVITGTTEQLEDAQKLLDDELNKLENKQKQYNSHQKRYTDNSSLLAIETTDNDSEPEINLQIETFFARLVPPYSDNELIEVFVSAAKSPNDFYVQLTGLSGIDLDNLMEQATDYYEIESNRTLMKLNDIKVGDIVAAQYPHDEHWYRAKILSIEPNAYSEDECNVNIFYLDYGDEIMLKRNQLCELKSEFLLKIPFQAIECSLSGIAPKYQIDWSEDAITRFKELTHMALWKPIHAKVIDRTTSGKKEKTFIQLFELKQQSSVSDDNSDVSDCNVDIGEQLIIEGFAIKRE